MSARATVYSDARPTAPRRGLTLVELVVTMALMTAIFAAIASTILIASHALPADQGQPEPVVDGHKAVEQLAGELYYAVSFATAWSSSVQFSVPDRNGDAAPETIRYVWSGTPGTALKRRYNGGTSVDVIDDVYEFELAYGLGGSSISSVGIRLRVGADPSARIETTIQVLNAPAVAVAVFQESGG